MEKCTITGYIVFMNFIHVGITLQHNKERKYDRKKNYWKTYRKRGSQATTFIKCIWKPKTTKTIQK